MVLYSVCSAMESPTPSAAALHNNTRVSLSFLHCVFDSLLKENVEQPLTSSGDLLNVPAPPTESSKPEV